MNLEFELFETKEEEKGFLEGVATTFLLFVLVSMFFVFPQRGTEVITYQDAERTYFYQDGKMWLVDNDIQDSWWIKDHPNR